MRHKGEMVALALVALILTGAAAAGAEAPTRAAYVDLLEEVCGPDAGATQKAMRGARTDLRKERLSRAAEKFAAATSIFGGTIREIAAVPRPDADRAKLRKWFGYLKKQESYLKRITAQLRADHAIAAQRLTARFIHNGNLANNTVIAFGFNYCSFKFSRYG
ncbi:MAG: hypothetical protein QOE75_618 [Solirubrobacterales bacterium]|nr:hypothetical protein [Solirubrobacterales bacterium]